jgi:hypothetical protein
MGRRLGPCSLYQKQARGYTQLLHKLDNTRYGSIAAAEDKARRALYFRRPSKLFEDPVAQGGLGLRTLARHGASPLECGIPLVADGKIIGAIGVSGATSVQDGHDEVNATDLRLPRAHRQKLRSARRAIPSRPRPASCSQPPTRGAPGPLAPLIGLG